MEKLFSELDRQLEKAGVILKRGTMLDATLIDAVSAPPTSERPSQRCRRPPHHAQGWRSTFGYKAHVGVDEGSGLIRTVITTPANVNDTVMADALICGDETTVWADAAYDTHARRARLKAQGKKARIARRPNKHHRAAAAAQALQSPDRPTTGGGGDHLRHAQAPHEADHDPLRRTGQGHGPGDSWRPSPSTLWEKVVAEGERMSGVPGNANVSLRWNAPHPSRRFAPSTFPPRGEGKERRSTLTLPPLALPSAPEAAEEPRYWNVGRDAA